MSGESFRFIQASDFHLETPLGDLDALPPQLREAMAEAPRQAAAAVFEAALSDQIDFLVLAGDLLNPEAAGPHGMALLIEYFERLNEKSTPVFWVAGLADDPARWPDSVPLPPNVTLFPKDRAIDVPVERAGRTICRVVGRSSDGRRALHVPSYQVDPVAEFTVAVGYGKADIDALAEAKFDYWAMGGQHNPLELPEAATGGGCYCGTPQGRSLAEPGPHGYRVVDVDAEGMVRSHLVECDTFRYARVELDPAEATAVGSLRNLMGEKVVRLQHENGGRHVLVGWRVRTGDGKDPALSEDAGDLLRWARREYGHGAPAAWSTHIAIDPPTRYPADWQEEDTILGDFLRASKKRRQGESVAANLMTYTEESPGLPGRVASLIAEVPSTDEQAILGDATRLGVNLLRGGQTGISSPE